MSNKVSVVISGEVITLKSQDEEAHLQRIARYIDRKLAELSAVNATASINERTRTIFLAANIADDYFKSADGLARANARNEKYVHELGRMQEEYAMLKEKFYEIQGELTITKSELDTLVSEYNKNLPGEGGNVRPLSLPRRKNAN